MEIAEDQNISKDLEPLALGLVKKFDRLQVLSKKDLNDGSSNLKNLKTMFGKGPVTPDHVIRIKSKPLIIESIINKKDKVKKLTNVLSTTFEETIAFNESYL